MIRFTTKLIKIKDWTILHLPQEASEKLPSRGMLMVKGTINNVPFKTLLEPDGSYGSGKKPSHWFSPGKKHLEVMLDKLNKGTRRPCCFNRNLCSEPYVSRNWALIEPR